MEVTRKNKHNYKPVKVCINLITDEVLYTMYKICYGKDSIVLDRFFSGFAFFWIGAGNFITSKMSRVDLSFLKYSQLFIRWNIKWPISNYMPSEFIQRPRALTNLDKFKAKEFKTFLL